ncbi:hypothetical protein [Prescottella equi]|uniref:hypothetical protein n=1 Tax=Rhodococcus hoagii TaxID=43767 RepID=UPI00111C13F8|nr:hypothetical protein [Prescottella equi]
MPRRYPAITRGTAEYDEVTRILGERRRQVLDESVTQISNRWLKGSFFVTDENGVLTLTLTAHGPCLVTERRRIRIPRRSFLARRPPRPVKPLT